ncbi:aminoglycoside phosphotransferase family protein [Kribbella sp. NPDC026611]|uniref:aminoglycoside phosphotransferase family protein n=1 Tax=Kribbella sp. NPDC026611 TaxID=3154911 RepID=UPI0033C44237
MIEIPAKLLRNHSKTRPEWLAGLPATAARYLDEWRLTVDGEPMSGEASLILPVARHDGTPAMLKLQLIDEESADEALALRTWNRDDVVEVYDDDPETATLLLERLEPQTLEDLPDHVEATRILAEILTHLMVVPAPPGIRTLADLANQMVADARGLLPAALTDPDERRVAERCLALTADVLGEPGDRLLHWDLHYLNVMAGHRKPWLVIDPKPLAGDPAFDLFPVLWNRWDDLVATGDIHQAIRDRYDLMLDVTGIDRHRADHWTAARVLQQIIWSTEDGGTRLDPELVAVAMTLFS